MGVHKYQEPKFLSERWELKEGWEQSDPGYHVVCKSGVILAEWSNNPTFDVFPSRDVLEHIVELHNESLMKIGGKEK